MLIVLASALGDNFSAPALILCVTSGDEAITREVFSAIGMTSKLSMNLTPEPSFGNYLVPLCCHDVPGTTITSLKIVTLAEVDDHEPVAHIVLCRKGGRRVNRDTGEFVTP